MPPRCVDLSFGELDLIEIISVPDTTFSRVLHAFVVSSAPLIRVFGGLSTVSDHVFLWESPATRTVEFFFNQCLSNFKFSQVVIYFFKHLTDFTVRLRIVFFIVFIDLCTTNIRRDLCLH
jgi:hypothetical protein